MSVWSINQDRQVACKNASVLAWKCQRSLSGDKTRFHLAHPTLCAPLLHTKHYALIEYIGAVPYPALSASRSAHADRHGGPGRPVALRRPRREAQRHREGGKFRKL